MAELELLSVQNCWVLKLKGSKMSIGKISFFEIMEKRLLDKEANIFVSHLKRNNVKICANKIFLVEMKMLNSPS